MLFYTLRLRDPHPLVHQAWWSPCRWQGGGDEDSASDSGDDSWTGDEGMDESESSSESEGEALAQKFLKKWATS